MKNIHVMIYKFIYLYNFQVLVNEHKLCIAQKLHNEL